MRNDCSTSFSLDGNETLSEGFCEAYLACLPLDFSASRRGGSLSSTEVERGRGGLNELIAPHLSSLCEWPSIRIGNGNVAAILATQLIKHCCVEKSPPGIKVTRYISSLFPMNTHLISAPTYFSSRFPGQSGCKHQSMGYVKPWPLPM